MNAKTAAKPVQKPTRTTRMIEVHTVVVPGKTEKDPAQRYHFTSHDTQVTADGVIYIPLSIFDLKRWADLIGEPNELS